jgi:metal-sulfur cluster biosynthetic enzyme
MILFILKSIIQMIIQIQQELIDYMFKTLSTVNILLIHIMVIKLAIVKQITMDNKQEIELTLILL